MSRKNKQHTKQFKLDAVNYRKEHLDLTQVECAKNLGIGTSTLARWEAQFKDNDGDIPTRESGNYSSDEAKEIARLKRELRDAQDALDVLKKSHQHSRKQLAEAIHTEVTANVEASKVTKRRVSISGMLKFLVVSRSGYKAFLN
ncbi:Transposase and inactivated derivatives [Butyrivibrio sp. INlla18]|uniref:transposase n=1 Tax=Butyrivibrio sp. INlla18 TaxID=1520806 RepID=UPI000885AEA9|nr:transposase [Butyrivibrio sp. INlla18]SDA73278.1 Transposase and inactivated derivatives [Butyrivibrio sp. INlla18]